MPPPEPPTTPVELVLALLPRMVTPVRARLPEVAAIPPPLPATVPPVSVRPLTVTVPPAPGLLVRTRPVPLALIVRRADPGPMTVAGLLTAGSAPIRVMVRGM